MHVFRTIFDWVFPPGGELVRVRSLNPERIALLYHRHKVEGVEVLASFTHPDVQALIHEAKFHNNTRACELLAVLIDSFLMDSTTQFDLVIPIPLSKKRLRERGHNQVVSVLRDTVCASLVSTHILLRTRHTTPQTELKREKRLQNVQGAFRVTRPEAIRGKRILIVDDVTTTGATLSAAKAALLLHHPASITCLAIAH